MIRGALRRKARRAFSLSMVSCNQDDRWSQSSTVLHVKRGIICQDVGERCSYTAQTNMQLLQMEKEKSSMGGKPGRSMASEQRQARALTVCADLKAESVHLYGSGYILFERKRHKKGYKTCFPLVHLGFSAESVPHRLASPQTRRCRLHACCLSRMTLPRRRELKVVRMGYVGYLYEVMQ